MKVQDLAKDLGTNTKELIRFLSEVDIKVKGGNTRLDDETITTIRDLFEGEESVPEAAEEKKTAILDRETLTVSDLAEILDVKLPELMKALLEKGLLLNLNSEIDRDTAVELGGALGVEVTVTDPKAGKEEVSIREHLEGLEIDDIANDGDMKSRPPVIVIMGHVDHGKTRLLDVIRESNVIDKEAGGITQHIGAYQVTVKDRPLTFLDTPGHEAFTALRARGSQVTDIAILVVAADESVKPQTIEAIHHAKAANVPIIVAINKVDKPEANVDRVKQDLSGHELVAEDWGGKTVMVPISAQNKTGIDELLDMILLVTDMVEPKANPDGKGRGVILESHLSRQMGPVASLLMMSGTLRVGDAYAIGATAGRVRSLADDRGKRVKEALPGDPVELTGISAVPSPGDILEVYPSERDAKEVAAKRQSELAEGASRSVQHVSMESLSQEAGEGGLRKLNLIVKADVNGSLDAILESISQIPSEDVPIHVLHSATGAITANDVQLAMASSAIVIGFGITMNAEAKKIAENDDVEVKLYKVIYEIVDDLYKVVEGMFKIEYVEEEVAAVEVRQLFKFSKVGIIAGSYVLSGKVTRGVSARVKRGGEVVYEGKVESLKRFKEDAKEVKEGFECGIVMDGFNELAEGDVIHCFEIREKNK